MLTKPKSIFDLEGFYFRWLKIKGSFPISITLLSNHLKWNLPELNFIIAPKVALAWWSTVWQTKEKVICSHSSFQKTRAVKFSICANAIFWVWIFWFKYWIWFLSFKTTNLCILIGLWINIFWQFVTIKWPLISWYRPFQAPKTRFILDND